MTRKRTEAQAAASMRNWGIRNLRGLYAQCFMLTEGRCARARAIIDEEFVARGADTYAQHVAHLYEDEQ